MNIDLELYKVFYTVACSKNISQAAEELYISQPAVSKSIKKLEDITGITLFYRNSRGVKLTEEGRIFFDYVEKAMKELSNGENILNKLKIKEQGVIKIGVSTTLCKHFLIPKLKSFIVKYPNIQIKIINNTTFDTLKLIDEGKVDFGIVSKPYNCSSYNFIEVEKIQDIFVSSKVYLESHGIVKPEEIFTKSTIMLLESDNITRKYIDEYFDKNNILVKPEIEISNMDFLIEFAKIGMGVTIVIRNFIEKEIKEGELVEISISPTIPKRAIGIVLHKKMPVSIAAQTFLDYVMQTNGTKLIRNARG